MLENMFIGKPPGNYNRLLDFSRAATGTLFFVPSATFLDDVMAEAVAPADAEPAAMGGVSEAHPEPLPFPPDGSLGIGSLKKDAGKE